MTLRYLSGQEVRAGDRVRYDGQTGEVEFVVDRETGDPARDWYLQELGRGVMVREQEQAKVFGLVYVTALEDGWLEFVARAEGD